MKDGVLWLTKASLAIGTNRIASKSRVIWHKDIW